MAGCTKGWHSWPFSFFFAMPPFLAPVDFVVDRLAYQHTHFRCCSRFSVIFPVFGVGLLAKADKEEKRRDYNIRTCTPMNDPRL
jgi:hypothetical protein